MGGFGFSLEPGRPGRRTSLLTILQQRVASGQRARWGLIGDSLTAGWGSNGASPGNGSDQAGAGSAANFRRSLAPAERLAAALNGRGIPARADAVCGTYTNAPTAIAEALASYTPRLSAEAGWTTIYGPAVVGGGAFRSPTGSTSYALIYTPAEPADSFEIFDIEYSGAGSFSVSDSSGVLGTRTSGTSDANARTVFTRPTPSLDPIRITCTSAGATVTINGIVPFDSTQPRIELWNMGWGGSKISDWTSKTAGYSPGNGLAQWQADHFSIELGANDHAASVATATYKSGLLSLVNILKAVTPSIGLIKSHAAYPAGNGYDIGAGYAGAIDELTAEQGLRPAIDFYAGITLALSDRYDGIHLVASGYQKKADKLLASSG